MIQVDKIKPETIIYGVLIIGAAWWLVKKGGEISDKYNPLDADNKVNIAARGGIITAPLKYSNPIMTIYEILKNQLNK